MKKFDPTDRKPNAEGGLNSLMASDPDIQDSRNELSLELFGKPLRLLTEEEMDMLNDEAERLMQKFSSKPKEAQSIKLAGGGLAYLMGM